MNDKTPDEDSKRLRDLLDALMNDSISSEDHAALQDILRDDPSAQETYFEHIDLEHGLRRLTESTEEQSTIHLEQAILSESIALPKPQPTNTDYSWLPRLAWGCVAAAVLVAVLYSPLWNINNRPQPAKNVAGNPPIVGPPKGTMTEEVIVIQSAGCTLFGEFLPGVGNTLEFHHEYALTSGMTEWKFPSGAQVILNAPCVVEIASATQLVVTTGSCSVYAPDGAEGFSVVTPQTRVVDLGTRFSVNVNDTGETDVQVVEGIAEVHAADELHQEKQPTSPPLRMTALQSRRFSGGAESTVDVLEFDNSQYHRLLPDRVVSFETRTDAEGMSDELLSVTIQRDGRDIIYPVDKLIGIKLTHFCAGKNSANVVMPLGDDGPRLANIEEDRLLQTGIINPGGATRPLSSAPVFSVAASSTIPATPGMAVQFHRPIVNSPGPDVVLFELQAVVDPIDGDAFHIGPVHFEDRLKTITIQKFDITMASAESRPLVHFGQDHLDDSPKSVSELINGAANRGRSSLRFRALAVGIDLSDLGYNLGESVRDLFIQDALDNSNYVDPVFIAGLPN